MNHLKDIIFYLYSRTNIDNNNLIFYFIFLLLFAKPGSNWKDQALNLLEKENVIQVGRYGRWVFQGIAESINDGFNVGGAYK